MATLIPDASIPELIEKEGLELWLCSYGGSGTNMLADYLEAKGLVVKTASWHKLLCHHAHPVSTITPIRAIYLFSDPVLAFLSMVRRGGNYYAVNQWKLNNDTDVAVSDHCLMASMVRQYENWTAPSSCNIPILALQYEAVFEEGKAAIAAFLGIDTDDFPERRPRASTSQDLGDHAAAVEPFREAIDRIRRAPPVRLIG